MKKIIKQKKEARQLIKNGIDKSADLIKITLGPSGRNAILGRPYQLAETTNDGISIAKEIYLDDEIEQLGAERIKEIAQATDDKAGDGTTTATVLTQAIFQAGFDRISNDFIDIDPIVVAKEITEETEKVLTKLDTMAHPIKTKEDIKKVAFVSVENEEIAEKIAEIYTQIGKDGLVTIEDYFGDSLDIETISGFEVEAGFSLKEMANSGKEYVAEKPAIIVTNIPITHGEQTRAIVTYLNQKNIKDLVIIGDSFSDDFIRNCFTAKMIGIANIITVKTPFFGRPEKLEDIAVALDAKFFEKDKCNLPITIEEVNEVDFGKCKKIIITKDKTLIQKPQGNTKQRIDILKEELKNTVSKFDKEQLNKRIAKLVGGISVIKVGADTETKRVYLKKKIEDVIHAVKHAMESGVVKGGGLAYKEIADAIEDTNILKTPLLAPYKQIQQNAGGQLTIGNDIIDPVHTLKVALKTASEVASTLLTVEVAIADKYEKPKDFKEED